MSLLRIAIGTVLRRLRQAQRRTLQDVADEAGVSMPYLSEIERGRKEASSEILAVICRALGIDLPDLLAEVRLELLRRPAVVPPRRGDPLSALSRPTPGRKNGTPSRPAPGSKHSALSRPAPVSKNGSRGLRTRRLAVCRTLSPTAPSLPKKPRKTSF